MVSPSIAFIKTAQTEDPLCHFFTIRELTLGFAYRYDRRRAFGLLGTALPSHPVYLLTAPTWKPSNRMIMKRLLSAITSAALLALGGFTTPAQAVIFGMDNDLQDILDPAQDVELSAEQGGTYNAIAFTLGLDYQANDLNLYTTALLDDPSLMSGLYADNGSGTKEDLLGEYCKQGCCVQAGCALDAIGLKLTLLCAPTSGTDPEAWANCVRDKDNGAYMAATACTSGDCPGFSSLPGEGVYACNQGSTAIASNDLLDPTLTAN